MDRKAHIFTYRRWKLLHLSKTNVTNGKPFVSEKEISGLNYVYTTRYAHLEL